MDPPRPPGPALTGVPMRSTLHDPVFQADPEGFPPFAVAALTATLLAAALLVILGLAPARALPVLRPLIVGGLHLACLVLFLRRSHREPLRAWGWWGFATYAALQVGVAGAALAGSPATGELLTHLALPAGIWGLMGWFEEGIQWAGGIRRVLEGCLFGVGLVALALLALPHPDLLQEVGAATPAFGVISAALLLGLTLFHARVDQRRLMGPLGWAALGFLGMGLRHTQALRALAPSAPGPAPLTWLELLLPLLLALGASAPWTRDRLSRDTGRGANLQSGLLVYIPTTLLVLALLPSLSQGISPGPIHLALLGLLAFLLLARQFYSLRDQVSFARILRARLEDRTRALEESREAQLRAHRMNLLVTIGAGMAHDLNNLLGALCVLVEREAPKEELLRVVHQAAALSRRTLTQAGHPEGALELFELGEAVAGLLPVLKQLAGKGVELAYTASPEEVWLEADPLKVEQALVNLICNARDAMAGQGRIHLCLRVEGAWARLTVDDDGSGIDPDHLPRIFEPFFTTKPKGLGNGLGLTSVKAVLDELGGEVLVATEAGQGSRFTLRFPHASLT